MVKNIKPIDNTVRTIPANIYDTLEFAALAFGGIGAGEWYRQKRAKVQGHFGTYTSKSDDETCPVCVNGLLVACGVDGAAQWGRKPMKALDLIDAQDNDKAVRKLQRNGFGKKVQGVSRVPWPAYCATLNIVRGAA